MTAQHLSSTAKASVRANNPADDGWTFRAPRHSDLIACPYCDDTMDGCDWCGGEGVMFSDTFEDGDDDRL